ncbi:LPD7 domain-containing protein [Paraburkholderia sp. HD33-4]|uniref:LPD7 domain-containing protein n=1 Tax=Paraburkholderia sp. HD33-4 TaxID=2883242 RepID=UPI001F304D28|nr:LPD7 domain-containing protein [Paraburkholderia sp. HD33-4]
MLVRVRGYHDGIKEYLEKGQKQDREFGRDEMDERVILAGDLELTNDIIQSMDTGAERYLHVTLSFKEDHVPREVLAEIVKEFEAFAFAAYRPDEYNLYAEAHVPRIKSYADRRSGDFVERKVHVHVVIPEVNLLTGRRLEPFGKVDRNHRFLEAFQEHMNAKYGLASPKDNRRLRFTDASEMISRYKGDIFRPLNRELKARILEAVVAGNVTRYQDFQTLLAEFGETRTRNAGRADAYENVKPPGADKGINLKEFVFSREFIELDAAAKRAALEHDVHAEYIHPGVPRTTSPVYLDSLTEWQATRAREIKYLNSGSSFYRTWQAASPEEQRRILEHREQRFYDAAGEHDERAPRIDGVRGSRDWRDSRHGGGQWWPEPQGGREPQWEQQWQEREAAQHRVGGRWRRGADHDFDARFDRPRQTSQSAHRVRGVSSRGMDGDAARRQMFLSLDALLELGNEQADRIDALRWTGDRERTGGEQPVLNGRLRERAPVLDAIATRMYAAWDSSDDAARARFAATAADKFIRSGAPFGNGPSLVEPLGLNSVLGSRQLPTGFGALEPIRSLADIPSLDAIQSLPFDEVLPVASDVAAEAFNALARGAAGREADTVRDQLAWDLVESRAAQRAHEREALTQIRVTLDATRLLAALAHSHGLMVEKYSVGKGADGGDRIRAGTRNLNVSDFLTKEMKLSWNEAAQMLCDTYRAQTARGPEHGPHRPPERDLWGEFLRWRSAYRDELRQAWDKQTQHEKARRGAIKTAFYDTRSTFADRMDLSSTERRDKLAAARVRRLEAEAALRDRIRRERAALKEAGRRPINEHYRIFLQERAQVGDERALHELRRMQQRPRSRHADEDRTMALGPAWREGKAPQQENEIFCRGPSITFEVRASGEVDYLKDGAALFIDEGRTVRLWDSERDAIEIALRFAQQKFGFTLSLSGPEDFQAAAARVAADLRMHIVFEQPETERMRQIRVAEFDGEAQDRKAAQRERDTWERDRLREDVRNLPPEHAQDITPPDEPYVPDGGPRTER